MTVGTRLRAGAFSVGVLILAAGCTTSSADGPTSTAVVSVTASPSVVDPSTFLSSSGAPPASPSPSVVEPSAPSSLDPVAQEAADRAAIEAQWAKFWDVYVGIVRIAPDQRSSALESVSVDPIKYRILDEAADFDSKGLDNYGSVVTRIYQWDFLGDGDQAVIQDCQDQSAYGSVFVESGKKRTVGVSDNHLQAGLIRGEDGIWRVQTVQAVENVPC